MQTIINKLWPEYTVEKELGEGSFGKVYKLCREEGGYKYNYALKIISIPNSKAEVESAINDGMDEASVTAYFRDVKDQVVKEVQLMYQLRGISNIVNYDEHKIIPHDNGIGWDIYIRMELLTPFFEYYRTVEDKYSNRDVAELGIHICRALEVCKRYSIIHRDIKPENIFISEIGNYKLGDFGIARQMEKTMSAMSKKGTYLYMAPEVYKGDNYDHTVDIYSLGIVLYRFLNQNKVPFLPTESKVITFTDKEMALVMRMRGDDLAKPCKADDALAEIVLKACAYRPQDRYQSATQMRLALEKVLPELTTYSMKEISEEPVGVLDLLDEEDIPDEPEIPVNVPVDIPVEDEQPEENLDGTLWLFDEEEKLRRIEAAKKAAEEAARKAAEEEAARKAAEEEAARKAAEEEAARRAAAKANGQKLKKILPIAAVVAVLGAVAIYFSTTTKVPYVTGITAENAKKQLEAASLIVEEGEPVYSDIYRKGNVLSVENEGKRLKKNSTVEMVVSLGAEIPLYELVGLAKEEAEAKLTDAGLVVECTEKYSDKYAAGTVMKQSPEKGKIVYEGDKIVLTVSKGSKPFELSDYEGMSLSEVEEKAEKLGLKLEVTKKFSTKVDKGDVISQKPKAGTEVKKGDTITLSVSKGAEQVKVPNLDGMTKSEAKKALEKAGLELGSVSYDYSDSVEKDIIKSQGVSAGDEADKGSSISVVISLGKRPVTVSRPSRPSGGGGSGDDGSTDITGGGSTEI